MPSHASQPPHCCLHGVSLGCVELLVLLLFAGGRVSAAGKTKGSLLWNAVATCGNSDAPLTGSSPVQKRRRSQEASPAALADPPWLAGEIRVRIVDKGLRGGALYLKKVGSISVDRLKMAAYQMLRRCSVPGQLLPNPDSLLWLRASVLQPESLRSSLVESCSCLLHSLSDDPTQPSIIEQTP